MQRKGERCGSKRYYQYCGDYFVTYNCCFSNDLFENRSDKKKEKIAIIKSLLSIGHYLYSDEIIRSYNLIDIVFKDDKNVRTKWKLYYEALCNDSLQYQVRLDKKLDLILAMCKSVNYKNIAAQDLQRVYVPKGFAEAGEKQRKYTEMQYQGMELLMQMLQKQTEETENK